MNKRREVNKNIMNLDFEKLKKKLKLKLVVSKEFCEVSLKDKKK